MFAIPPRSRRSRRSADGRPLAWPFARCLPRPGWPVSLHSRLTALAGLTRTPPGRTLNLIFGTFWFPLVTFGHLSGSPPLPENGSAEKMARNGQETVKFYDSGQALTKVGQIGGQVFKSRGRPTGLNSQRQNAFLFQLWGFECASLARFMPPKYPLNSDFFPAGIQPEMSPPGAHQKMGDKNVRTRQNATKRDMVGNFQRFQVWVKDLFRAGNGPACSSAALPCVHWSLVTIGKAGCLQRPELDRKTTDFTKPLGPGALTEKMWRWAARIFGIGRGFGDGAGLNNPVTELKRSRIPKPLLSCPILPSLQVLWICSKFNLGKEKVKFGNVLFWSAATRRRFPAPRHVAAFKRANTSAHCYE